MSQIARSLVRIVDTSRRGVSVGASARKIGNCGQLTADVRFTDVDVDGADLLGGTPGNVLRQALQTLTGAGPASRPRAAARPSAPST